MKGLSDRQIQILNIIKKVIKEKGYSPTAEDIGKELGITSGAMHGHLARLEKKGKIKRLYNQNRSIVLTDYHEIEKDEIVMVPVVGCVTAGQPILAQEHIETYFPVPKEKVKGEAFMLRVKGDSMQNAGILDGDLILVEKKNVAENGEVVVAMTEDDEATVKRFFKEEGYYRLQPENDKYEPIIIDHIKILGKVKSVHRMIPESTSTQRN